jgi:hypothetical protein
VVHAERGDRTSNVKGTHPQAPGSPVLALEKTTPGPVGVGTHYREVVRMLPGVRGEIRSVVTRFDPPTHLEEDFEGAGMAGHLAYTFVPERGGTQLIQRQCLVARGWLAPLAPLIRLTLAPRLRQRLADIKGVLEGGRGERPWAARVSVAAALILLAVVTFVATILLAQLVAPPDYDWTRHTVSELAAQGQEHAWVMRAGLVAYGLLLTAALLVKARAAGHRIARDLPLLGYAAGIALAGISSTAPIDVAAAYSPTEARWHSWFATAAGWSFSAGILWYALTASRPLERAFHYGTLAAVTGASLAFGLAEGGVIDLGEGVIQRALYALGLTWLVVAQWHDLAHIESSFRPSRRDEAQPSTV